MYAIKIVFLMLSVKQINSILKHMPEANIEPLKVQ